MASITIEDLWAEADFAPNPSQRHAILHTAGPLFLTAGPGSGKTRVLLWRTVNLIVFHEVKPEEIFLSTFTEKAAFQLKEGLRALLGLVTNRTGKPYDIPTRLRVWDNRKSECFAVMAEIRVTTKITRRESEQTSVLVFVNENGC